MSPLLDLGSERTLRMSDLPPLAEKDKAAALHEVFKLEWAAEVRQRGLEDASLRRVFFRIFKWPVFKQMALLVIECLCMVVQVVMLRWILLYLAGDTEEISVSKTEGYIYASVMGLTSIIMSFTHHQVFYGGVEIGINARAGVTCMLFAKTLRLSAAGMAERTQGKVLNLVTSDAMRFVEFFKFINFLVAVPIMMTAVITLLVMFLGPESLLSVAILLLWTPVQVWFAQRNSKIRGRAVRHTDERIKVIGEALNAGISMKMHCWEDATLSKCAKLRVSELGEIESAAQMRAINLGMFVCTQAVACVPTLMLMVFHADRKLTTADVFTLLAFFNMLRFPVAFVMPFVMQLGAEVMVTLGRMNSYLKLPECEGGAARNSGAGRADLPRKATPSGASRSDAEAATLPGQAVAVEMTPLHAGAKENDVAESEGPAVEVKNGTFSWGRALSGDGGDDDVEAKEAKVEEAKEDSPALTESRGIQASRGGAVACLTDITFTAERKTLTVVVGAIGSGKSSLLEAILGEMTTLNGRAVTRGRVAYVPQRPWIFSDSVRNNVCFGRPYDPQWYATVVRACALKPDIDSFPQADFTVVGERGVSLSGGQKSRVALARAVYARPAVLLADDPLSAVDYNVAQTIFKNVFGSGSVVPDACRVLVTHHVHLGRSAKRMLVIKNGRLVQSGPHDELDWSDPDLAQLKIKTKKENKEVTSNDTELKASAPGSPKSRASSRAAPVADEVDLKKTAEKKSIIVREKHDEGGVNWEIYSSLARANGSCGVLIWILVLVIMIMGQFLLTGLEYWVARWARSDDQKASFWVISLAVLTVLCVVVCIGRALSLYTTMIRTSRNIHAQMLDGVLRTSTVWLQSQPIGRVLNRFSQDTAIIDELFPLTLYDFTQCLLIAVAAAIVIFLSSPWMLLFLVPTAPAFLWVRRKYVTSSRELKRLDGISRSPQFVHFGGALQGLSTIRAFDRATAFLRDFLPLVDQNCRTTLVFEAAARWLALRLDLMAAVFVVATPLIFVTLGDTVDPSVAGLAMTYAVALNALFPWMVRQSAEVENLMTSVERAHEYMTLPREETMQPPDAERIEKRLVDEGWPPRGEIRFESLSAKYRGGLPLVLKDLCFDIKPGEVVGVCGRSGSGKSTLFSVVFRILEKKCVEGRYLLDGQDTARIPISSLRRRLSVIPQEPVLFSGTLRYNLDPFGEHSDEAISAALEKVGLRRMSQTLDHKMAEFGANLSVGESQLLCVARSLLRPAKVLLVDEATAHVDAHTDTQIQKVLRTEFKDRTILIIAHRLHTIMHCDRVMVIDEGRVAELGPPQELLRKERGLFRKLRDQGRDQNQGS